MKLTQKILNYFRKDKESPASNYSLNFINTPAITGTMNAYKSFAYACINARAENISKAKYYLYKETAETGIREIKKHKILELLNKPNVRQQTFKEILFKCAISLDLYGDAFVYIRRDKNGTPLDLYHLPTKTVRIKLNSDSTEIEQYEYSFSGGKINYPAKDIIHFLIPDPDNNFGGKATIEGFNMSLEIDYLQNRYQRNFYKNDASPAMAIEFEKNMSDIEFNRFKEKFRSLYEGVNNTGKTIFLDNGAKIKPMQSYPKDVEILQSRTWIRDEIMSIFRVPKIILGVTSDVNRANASQQLATFNENVIKPFAKLTIESKLNSFIARNFPGEDLFINMEYEFENDREMQLKAYEIYMKYGILTKDELRELEGYQPIKKNKNGN